MSLSVASKTSIVGGERLLLEVMEGAAEAVSKGQVVAVAKGGGESHSLMRCSYVPRNALGAWVTQVME